jgi:hypothetical protein
MNDGPGFLASLLELVRVVGNPQASLLELVRVIGNPLACLLEQVRGYWQSSNKIVFRGARGYRYLSDNFFRGSWQFLKIAPYMSDICLYTFIILPGGIDCPLEQLAQGIG